jgi:L-amino acid N-acyltransferase YncA
VASGFYPAEAEDNVAGFLLPANAASLRVMRRGMDSEDAAATAWSTSIRIAVRPCYQQGGIGLELNQRLEPDAAGRTRMGAILHEPVRNAASIGLFEKEGFHCGDKMQEADMLWGIYER